MSMTRRSFLRSTGAAVVAAHSLSHARPALAQPPKQRAIYYNNFASHLLCAYNPNMYYPDLPYRWSDDDWRRLIDMIAAFGFNVFEFWVEPRLFCREGIESAVGREFARQMNVAIDQARLRGMQAEMITGIATVGEKWRTLCPNVKEEWDEVRYLWDAWTRLLPGLGAVGIFPGDPGACSRNGCTAETYIDKSAEIAALVRKNLPDAEIDLNLWGPPIFGWGNIHMPPESKGEFIPADQGTAWTFSKERADRAMTHLLKRLPDFPGDTLVSINLGFNSDGNPVGDQDARPWANEIAKTHPILTWDFSLTEGENAVYPHYRFERLFARRAEERAAAPYSGGICFTMTPKLNQLSLYESAQSFHQPDGRHAQIAGDFFENLFGHAGRGMVDDYAKFEVVPDWGSYVAVQMPRAEYHAVMTRLADALEDLKTSVRADAVFFPDPESYRAELVFFARFFAALSAPQPDYDALRKEYWERVYRIYDALPAHVDPRPHAATDRLIKHFADWG